MARTTLLQKSHGMTSFKARMFSLLMRNNHLLRGKIRKEVFDLNTSIEGFRAQCARGAARHAQVPAGITVRQQLIQGMNAEFLIPEEADPRKIILYVHGGGYVSGSCNDHRGFVSKFAKYTGVTNLMYEYRLAPEHSFPAALEDSVSIYRWLLKSAVRPEDILLAGESAGGGLCLALLLALKARHIDLPAAAVAISPWTDLSCSGDSYHTKNKRSPAPLDSWKVFSHHYAAGQSLQNPLISPLFGNLEGLPPVFINAAVDDELYDDGYSFYQKAQAAGVEVTFRPGKDMVHCYPLLAPMFAEATDAMNEMVAFISKHLQMPSQAKPTA